MKSNVTNDGDERKSSSFGVYFHLLMAQCDLWFGVLVLRGGSIVLILANNILLVGDDCKPGLGLGLGF